MSEDSSQALPTPPSGSEKQKGPGALSQLSQHLRREVSINHADIPIIACCLVSGLCDSVAYDNWTCFVSMQTGNTVFLALGASNQPYPRPYGWLKSFVSILTFLLGCFCFGLSRNVGPLHRRTLSVSFFVQSCCIIIAAALVQSGVVPELHGLQAEDTSVARFIELLPLAFLAFQSGGQIVTSRLLGFNEVPTTVLTSVYCDIASDPKLLAPLQANVKRNRRVCAVITFLIGAICGGWLTRSRGGMSSALWISAFIKMCIAVGWSLWKEKAESPV